MLYASLESGAVKETVVDFPIRSSTGFSEHLVPVPGITPGSPKVKHGPARAPQRRRGGVAGHIYPEGGVAEGHLGSGLSHWGRVCSEPHLLGGLKG